MSDTDLMELEKKILQSLQTPLTPSENNPYGNVGDQAFPLEFEVSIEIPEKISQEVWGLRSEVSQYAYSVARIRRLRAIFGENPDELYQSSHLAFLPLFELEHYSDWDVSFDQDVLSYLVDSPPSLGLMFTITRDEQKALVDLVIGAILSDCKRNPYRLANLRMILSDSEILPGDAEEWKKLREMVMSFQHPASDIAAFYDEHLRLPYEQVSVSLSAIEKRALQMREELSGRVDALLAKYD